MNERSTRLEPVSRLERTREREAARHLGDRQRELARQQERLEELLRYREEYHARATRVMDGRRRAGIEQLRRFLAQLDAAIEQQQELVRRCAEQVAHSREAWLSRRARRKAVDSLVERLRGEERRQRGRVEQQALDELAGRSVRRGDTDR